MEAKKMKRNIKGLMTLAALSVLGFSTMAFAWGAGYNGHMGMGRGSWGSGGGYMCGYGPGDGYSNNLSPDQLNRLDQERTEFFKGTEDLRQSLYTKELELRNELTKENPDAARTSNLQSEISNLQGQLDQKSLGFEMRARKAVPGYRGYGRMMGHGYGGGNCMW